MLSRHIRRNAWVYLFGGGYSLLLLTVCEINYLAGAGFFGWI